MTQLDVLGRNFVPMAVAILVSTLVGLTVAGWIMQRFAAPEDQQ